MNRAVLVLLAAVSVFGEVELPSVAPQVSSMFPLGGQRGTEVEIEIRGSYLDQLERIEFLDRQLDATVLSSKFRLARAKVRIAPDAEAGFHDFRLITPRGAYLGVFVVGVQPEMREVESNDSIREAQLISLPALINGQADAADANYFRFRVEAGQTIVFDVMATRAGSALDPVLTLLDERGREIDYCDDFYTFKDARLVHTFRRPGQYTLVVSASFERSARYAGYRLLATAGPFPTFALPLGGARGKTVDVTVKGWNLDTIDRAWLGKKLATAQVVRKTATEVWLRLPISPGLAAGSYLLHLASGEQEAPAPLRFEISGLPEVTLAGTNSLRDPLLVEQPVVINGEIGDAGGEPLRRAHFLEFDARKGARYEFTVDSWKLGTRLDPVVTLLDSRGRPQAQEDDPAPNSFIHHPASHDPQLVWVFDEPGRYLIQVRDAAYQGGTGAGYRLTIRETEPAFWLEVRTPQLTVYSGRTARLLAVVHRTGGVHRVEGFKKPDSEIEHFRIVEKDGWNTPVRVWVEGLPEGVITESVYAPPKNTEFKGNDGEELFVDGTLVEIPIHVAAGARPGTFEVTVRAEGSFQGRSIQQRARVRYGSLRAPRAEPTSDQKLLITVVDPPPVLWNVPPDIRVRRGGAERLKIGVSRIQGDFPIELEPQTAPPGWEIRKASVAAGAAEIELLITARDNAEPGVLVLSGSFDRGGSRERVASPPIDLGVR